MRAHIYAIQIKYYHKLDADSIEQVLESFKAYIYRGTKKVGLLYADNKLSIGYSLCHKNDDFSDIDANIISKKRLGCKASDLPVSIKKEYYKFQRSITSMYNTMNEQFKPVQIKCPHMKMCNKIAPPIQKPGTGGKRK